MTTDRRTPFPGAGRPEPVGAPTWTAEDGLGTCPHCGARLVSVSCPVKPPPQLRTATGRAVARYLGCPACTYASPAMITAWP